ncbi:hypothetical protein ACFY3U_18110 [Micromonospora sp. NPDC000089]|uniref:hypothetical protein n=1 Tax=unclassified Micromonospora TaxID=2617518 RepID=UPI0036B2D7C3
MASVLVLGAPASAKPGGAPGRSYTLTLPAAPRGFVTQPGVTAVAPTITSAPGSYVVRYVAAGQPATCASGKLCNFVWDPTGNRWKIFDLYYCGLYQLANWRGAGFYTNAQTPPFVVTFYGSSSGVVTTNGTGSQNWDPVYAIRPC